MAGCSPQTQWRDQKIGWYDTGQVVTVLGQTHGDVGVTRAAVEDKV